MSCLLKCENISYSYHSLSGETPVLENISFSVSEGEFIVIIGNSGCGKSTLLSILSGLNFPEKGSLRFYPDTDKESDKINLGYMLQRDYLFEWLTIYQNILLGLKINHRVTSDSVNLANQYLKEYGLYDFRMRHPHELSGGMRQRAALIRTLLMQPDLLLLDEPFSALDYQTRLNVSDDISHLIRSSQKTAIMITHDLSEALSIADRILVLSMRPATIKRNIEIHLKDKNSSIQDARKNPEFSNLFNLLWEDLNENK